MSKWISRARQWKGFRIFFYVTLPFFALFCLFIMEYMNFDHYEDESTLVTIGDFLTNCELVWLFSVLLILFLFFVLLVLFRRGWLAGTVLAVVSCGLGCVNYLKLAINGDPLYPKDFLLLQNADEMAGFVNVVPPTVFWWYLVILAVMIFFYAFFRIDLKLRLPVRLPLAVGLILLLCLGLGSARGERYLRYFGIEYGDTMLQSTNYYQNGFVGGFTVNLLLLHVEPPEGYSEEKVDEILEGYSSTPITGEELYDVVVVLEESFFDVRQLEGVTYSENPLSHYDDVISRPNCYSGNMYTTVIGGGTIRPEFECLSGLSTSCFPAGATPYEYVTRDLDTYISNYKDAGYTAIAMHPYDKSFYSREKAYAHLGFDAFYGQDELELMGYQECRKEYISDNMVMQTAQMLLDAADEPTVLFIITMENHYPYYPMAEEDINVQVESSVLDEEMLSTVTTYTQGIYDTDQFIGGMADYIDGRERPTVMLLFGDHLPSLGANYVTYQETGFFDPGDGMTTEEYRRMYSTPFLIYANRTMEIPMFPEHQGNVCSPYHFLNAVALGTGFQRTPYMNFLLDCYYDDPDYNMVVTRYPAASTSALFKKMKVISYDRVIGKQYSQ